MRNKNRNASLPKKLDAVVAVKKSQEIKRHVLTREESLAVLVFKEAKPAIVTCASVVPVLTRKAKGRKSTQCRCGEAKKGHDVEQTVSCVDITGRKRTKCPCFTAGLACKGCKCYSCKNSFGKNAIDTPTKGNGQEKKRKSTLSTSPSLKRQRE